MVRESERGWHARFHVRFKLPTLPVHGNHVVGVVFILSRHEVSEPCSSTYIVSLLNAFKDRYQEGSTNS